MYNKTHIAKYAKKIKGRGHNPNTAPNGENGISVKRAIAHEVHRVSCHDALL